MTEPSSPVYFGGLDLGQMADYTALAVLERREHLEEGRRIFHYAVRYLQRWPLRTPYPDIIADVVKVYEKETLAHSQLTVDRTGVGVAVADQLHRANPKAWLVPITITGGAGTALVDGCWSVPKRELAGVLQVLLGTRRLKVSPALPLAKVLTQEMSTFRVKINIATGNESFEAWRERDHDDLVLAVALACWSGEQDVPFECATVIETPPPRSLEPRYDSAQRQRGLFGLGWH